MDCSRECRHRLKVSPHKIRSKGSKAWFIGRKHSAFLDRNRGHDRYSANGLLELGSILSPFDVKEILENLNSG